MSSIGGWRYPKNKSFSKFPVPWRLSFRKYSISNFLIVTLRSLSWWHHDTKLQRNPVNTVINGPKKNGRINGVAVLPGVGWNSWRKGLNDKYRICTSRKTFLFNKQQEYTYSNCMKYLKLRTVGKTLKIVKCTVRSELKIKTRTGPAYYA